MDDIWGRFWKAAGPPDTHAPAQVGGACRAPGTKSLGFGSQQTGVQSWPSPSTGPSVSPSLGSQVGLAPGGLGGLTTVSGAQGTTKGYLLLLLSPSASLDIQKLPSAHLSPRKAAHVWLTGGLNSLCS